MSEKNLKFVKKIVNEIVERHMINELESRRSIAEALIIGIQLGGMDSTLFQHFVKLDATKISNEIINE